MIQSNATLEQRNQAYFESVIPFTTLNFSLADQSLLPLSYGCRLTLCKLAMPFHPVTAPMLNSQSSHAAHSIQ